MTEQAGHLNEPDLVEECARAAVNGYHEGNADWDDVNEMERLRGVFCAEAVLSVLRKRGLLTIQALELLNVDR